MNHVCPTLDAAALLRRVAAGVPKPLRAHLVVVGSIAAAWSYRDIAGTDAVATKDIDLRDAHSIALASVLAAHGTTLGAYMRAHGRLLALLAEMPGEP